MPNSTFLPKVMAELASIRNRQMPEIGFCAVPAQDGL
jgi:hypothetical protein